MKNLFLIPITASHWLTMLAVYLMWKTVFQKQKPIIQTPKQEVDWFSL